MGILNTIFYCILQYSIINKNVYSKIHLLYFVEFQTIAQCVYLKIHFCGKNYFVIYILFVSLHIQIYDLWKH
jgi:hypothetical protein